MQGSSAPGRRRLAPVLSFTLVAVLLSSAGGMAADHFSDVPDDHRFAVEIGWLVSEGVTTGFADGTFRPTVAVSRQAAAAFLYRLAGEPPVAGVAGFSDVPDDHRFAVEIGWLVSEGVTSGFEDGTFRPTSPVTRQAAAAFLYRLAGEPPVAGVAGFSDVPDDHRFAEEIGWLVSEGVTTGFEDGTFRPTNPVTRQAIAAFLYRYTTDTPADPGPDPAHPRAGENWALLGCTNDSGTCRYPPGGWFELETRGPLAQRCQLWDYSAIPHRCLYHGGALGVIDASGGPAVPGQDTYTSRVFSYDPFLITYRFPLHRDAAQGLWTGRLCDSSSYTPDCADLVTVYFEVAD